jgi:hypothetical protein
MSRLAAWLLRNARLTAWLSGALAVVLIAGGVALGISRTPGPPPELSDGPLEAQPVSARVDAGRHSVVGTVRAVGPAELLIRSQRGVYFTVRWLPATQFRRDGAGIKPAALRPGDRAVVIGRPAGDGSLVASFVTVFPEPSPSPSPPGGSSP